MRRALNIGARFVTWNPSLRPASDRNKPDERPSFLILAGAPLAEGAAKHQVNHGRDQNT